MAVDEIASNHKFEATEDYHDVDISLVWLSGTDSLILVDRIKSRHVEVYSRSDCENEGGREGGLRIATMTRTSCQRTFGGGSASLVSTLLRAAGVIGVPGSPKVAEHRTDGEGCPIRLIRLTR